MSEQGGAFRLSAEDRREIQKRRQKEKDIRIYVRYKALLWLDDGKSVQEVADLLDRDPSTLRKWLKLYEKKGSTGSIISLIAEMSET
jgi:transposase-like protein